MSNGHNFEISAKSGSETRFKIKVTQLIREFKTNPKRATKTFFFFSFNLLKCKISQFLSLLLLISYFNLEFKQSLNSKRLLLKMYVMRFIVMFVTAVCVLFLIKRKVAE